MAEKASPRPTPNERLVSVFESEQESEALVVQGLLDSAGIDCEVAGIEHSPDVLPIGGMAVLVREADLRKAQDVIAEYRRSPEDQEVEDLETE